MNHDSGRPLYESLHRPAASRGVPLFCGARAPLSSRKHDFRIDDFIEATASGQASEKHRRLDELMNVLQLGDRLVVSELSRLGRSLGQIVAILDALAKAGVAFVAMKENIRVEGKRDIQTKVMTTLFALFAEVDRDLISERTRQGLAQARSSGRKLSHPRGSLGVSRLNGKEDDIRRFLELGVSKTAIAKLTGVSRTTLYSFMKDPRAQAEPLACISARILPVPYSWPYYCSPHCAGMNRGRPKWGTAQITPARRMKEDRDVGGKKGVGEVWHATIPSAA